MFVTPLSEGTIFFSDALKQALRSIDLGLLVTLEDNEQLSSIAKIKPLLNETKDERDIRAASELEQYRFALDDPLAYI